MTIANACALARMYARYTWAGAVQILIEAGLSLQCAARYVLAALRAQRGAA